MAKFRSDSGISSTLEFVRKEPSTSPNGIHQETENLIKNSCEVEIEVEIDECGEFVIDV